MGQDFLDMYIFCQPNDKAELENAPGIYFITTHYCQTLNVKLSFHHKLHNNDFLQTDNKGRHHNSNNRWLRATYIRW